MLRSQMIYLILLTYFVENCDFPSSRKNFPMGPREQHSMTIWRAAGDVLKQKT